MSSKKKVKELTREELKAKGQLDFFEESAKEDKAKQEESEEKQTCQS